ncbi:MAG TPA: M23 family metallopeptidase [Gaiellales bacterium]|jgi:hypothetical protein
MTRIAALIIFCSAALAAGVVLATPSLASAFRTHYTHVHYSHDLWNWSVSGGTTTSAAPAKTTKRHTRKGWATHGRKTTRHHSTPAPVVTPPPTTTEPTTTTPPPATTTPTPTFEAIPNTAFTLHAVDARCFGATTSPGGWPFAPTTAVHPIRGSFDEPRGPVHIGVDVEAPRDQAPVYAMQAGKVTDIQPDHFNVIPTRGPRGSYLQYWHVNLLSTVKAGTVVRRRQELGTVKKGMLHVHISEYAAGCGLVDPARPHGLLADPYNTEWPAIGPLTAMVAGSRAFIPLSVGQSPTALTDPARPISLDDLTGTVDFRTSVTDTPKVKMQHNPQLPLAPAAIRAYLAPTDDTHKHFVTRTIFDGSRLLPTGSRLWRFWAFGTYRQNGCYFTAGGACGAQMIWHVGGPSGFNTKTVPDGSYKYCVEALTIAGVDARRCTVVTIKN